MVQLRASGAKHCEDCWCGGGSSVHDQLFLSQAMFRKEIQPTVTFEYLEHQAHRAWLTLDTCLSRDESSAKLDLLLVVALRWM